MRKAGGTLGLAALTAALLISGCGPAAIPGPLSIHAAGRAYLKDVAPDNQAYAAFYKLANTWTASTTAAQIQAGIAPLIAADERFQAALTDTDWPASARADIRRLAASVATEIADLENMPNAGTEFLSVEWQQSWNQAGATFTLRADMVRHDLALPPVKP